MMKKFLMSFALALASMSCMAQAAKEANIVFEQDTINLGEFSKDDPVQECVYTFTNTGDAPLIINQAIASCGCTVPDYDKQPIKPGESGQIKVTYNGKGKLTGSFTKTITVRSNAKNGVRRLFLKGYMTD